MFLVLLRPLLIVSAILLIGLFAWRAVRKVELTEETKVKLIETQIIIDEILREAKELPDVNKKKLEAARVSIEEFLKEGTIERKKGGKK